MDLRTFTAVIFAFLVPGAGHFYLGRRARAVAFFSIVIFLFLVGLAVDGKLYTVEPGKPLTFLATIADEPVGIIRCVETPASPLLAPDRYCYVSSAYVKPEHRRHGVLRALLDRADAWCRERGLGEMRLHNVGTNAEAASAWDSLEFEVVEQVRLRRVHGTAQALETTAPVATPVARP